MEIKEYYLPGRLPSYSELEILPLYAKVGLAAKFARMLLDYFPKMNGFESGYSILDDCIRTAERIGKHDFNQHIDLINGEIDHWNTLLKTEQKRAVWAIDILMAIQKIAYIGKNISAGMYQYLPEDIDHISRVLCRGNLDKIQELRIIFDDIRLKTFEYQWSDASVWPLYYLNPISEHSNLSMSVEAQAGYESFRDTMRSDFLLYTHPVDIYSAIFSPKQHLVSQMGAWKEEMFLYQQAGEIFNTDYCKCLFSYGKISMSIKYPQEAKYYLNEAFYIYKTHHLVDDHLYSSILIASAYWEKNYGQLPDECFFLKEWLDNFSDQFDQFLEVKIATRYITVCIELGLFEEGQRISESFKEKGFVLGQNNSFDCSFYHLFITILRIEIFQTNYKEVTHHVGDKISKTEAALTFLRRAWENIKSLEHDLEYRSTYEYHAYLVAFVELAAELNQLCRFSNAIDAVFIAQSVSHMAKSLIGTFDSRSEIYSNYLEIPYELFALATNTRTVDDFEFLQKAIDYYKAKDEHIRGQNWINRQRGYTQGYPNMVIEFGRRRIEEALNEFPEPGSTDEKLLSDIVIHKEELENINALFKDIVPILQAFVRINIRLLNEEKRINLIKVLRPKLEFLTYFFSVLADQQTTSASCLLSICLTIKGQLAKASEEMVGMIRMINSQKLNAIHEELRTRRQTLKKEEDQRIKESSNRFEDQLLRLIKLDMSGRHINPDDVTHYQTELSKRLKTNECILEILNFRTPNNDFPINGFKSDSFHFLILIITAQKPEPDKIVVSIPSKRYNNIESDFINYLRNEDTELGLRLYSELWQPIVDKVSEFEKVYLAPDGIYASINFESLPTLDGKYLVDSHEISLISSAFDMFNRNDSDEQSNLKKATLYGDLDYKNSDLELTSSGKEIDNIATILESRSVKCKLIKEDQGTAEHFINDRSDLIHFATHGWKREEDTHPLKKFWLQLSTVDHSIESITGLDILNANLDRTKLIVFSACNSSSGTLLFGQGTYNLAHCCKASGVSFVVSSVYNLSDYFTSELMTHFYEEIDTQVPTRTSFRNAVLKTKAKWKSVKYWGSFHFYGV